VTPDPLFPDDGLRLWPGRELDRRCPFCRKHRLIFDEASSTPFGCIACGVRFDSRFEPSRPRRRVALGVFVAGVIAGVFVLNVGPSLIYLIAGVTLIVGGVFLGIFLDR
jgi:hypothetical protein